jgi:GNAT superfamily N-acetyltransferase
VIDIIEIKTELQIDQMIELERNRTGNEMYDCPFETYEKILRGALLKENSWSPNFRAWIGYELEYENKRPVGYMLCGRMTIPRNQITIEDMMVVDDFWGKGCLELFIKKVIEWMKEEKVSKLITATIASAKAWQRIVDKYDLGVTVKEQLAVRVEVN